MVLILSIEGDSTTDEICKYFELEGKAYIRLNDAILSKTPPKIRITPDKQSIEVNNQEIVLDENLTVWFRKFGFFKYSGIHQSMYQYSTIGFIRHEYNTLINYITSLLVFHQKILIGTPKKVFNKIIQLQVAKKIGLMIPDYIVSNSKAEILAFLDKNKACIVKPLGVARSVVEKNKRYHLITLPFTKEDIDLLPKNSLPSMIQKRINKKFEIRAFYLDGSVYSMAIFSQSRDSTKVDFRNTDTNHKIRMIPYQLDKKTTDKIRHFMHHFGLETGSFDFICDEDDNLVFLEVNPSGQFSMVAAPCNYNLEFQVFDYLTNQKA
jgi:ATP-GRASP peptide maturase of grasp-with-spasm system